MFGNCKLKDITTGRVSEFLTSLEVKSSTSRKVKIVMQSILECAVGQGYIKSNPCVGTTWKSGEMDDAVAKILIEHKEEQAKAKGGCPIRQPPFVFQSGEIF